MTHVTDVWGLKTNLCAGSIPARSTTYTARQARAFSFGVAPVKIPTITGEQAKQQRMKLGMSQTEYWNKVAVHQSSSSRYEQGRNIPRSVQLLLHIAYGSPARCESVVQQIRGAA